MSDQLPDASTPDPAAALRAQLERANERLIHAELKTHAVRAGIIDLDCLKLLDTASLKLDDDGNLPGAKDALAALKRDKPWLFVKPNTSHPAPAPAPELPKTRMAKDMSYQEWQAARARLIRGR